MTPKKNDPITVEVVRNAIVAYGDEMAEALCKSAYNMMIYEVRDYCCGLIDTTGRMISQNRGGLPIFLADLGIAVEDGIKKYGLQGFAEGDVLVMNHGHICGQHLNNVVVYAPCFHEGELIGFCRQPRALGRYRRWPPGLRFECDDRHLLRRPADALAEDLQGRRAERHALPDHPGQYPLSGCQPSATCVPRSPPARSVRNVIPNSSPVIAAAWCGELRRDYLGSSGQCGPPGHRAYSGRHLLGRELSRQ